MKHLVLGVAAILSACAGYRPTNAPLRHWDPDYGHRPKTVQASRPMGEIPTTFTLPDETVDRLIEAGRRLLRESPEFQRLLAALHADHAGGGRAS